MGRYFSFEASVEWRGTTARETRSSRGKERKRAVSAAVSARFGRLASSYKYRDVSNTQDISNTRPSSNNFINQTVYVRS
jgi:hypothetical protein